VDTDGRRTITRKTTAERRQRQVWNSPFHKMDIVIEMAIIRIVPRIAPMPTATKILMQLFWRSGHQKPIAQKMEFDGIDGNERTRTRSGHVPPSSQETMART
jgi:hypothetical protein